MSCGYRSPGWTLGPDVGHASSPVHKLSPQPLADSSQRRVILDETGGSAFAAHVARADHVDEGSAAKRPRALGDDGKSRAMRMAS